MGSEPHPRRIASIDLIRGLVMVLMALDHARDYFFDARIIVEHTEAPGAALFLTRWVTHLCAPVFVFLAGVSVWLWRSRPGREQTSGATSRYLLSRGLWLVALEFTLVSWAWSGFWPQFLLVQVIAAIGVSMVALALLVHLPRTAVLALGIAIVGGHNLLDAYACENPYGQCPWWQVLFHQEGLFVLPGWLGGRIPANFLFVKYPLLPWIGVIALGYGMGGVFQLPRARRTRVLLVAGLGAAAGFVALRASGVYGDPIPLAEQVHGDAAWMRFLNVEKYPPSLLFLLMTLGPALVLLAVAEAPALARSQLGGWLTTFGTVPLFYYVAHVWILRVASEAWYRSRDTAVPKLLLENFDQVDGYGELSLGVTYAVWLGTVALLYAPCRWYARLKRRSDNPLLTYL